MTAKQRGRKPRWPFAYMSNIGDSFIYGGPRTPDYVSARAVYWQRKTGWKFERRKVDGGWLFRRYA